jgi:hypothetical protein
VRPALSRTEIKFEQVRGKVSPVKVRFAPEKVRLSPAEVRLRRAETAFAPAKVALAPKEFGVTPAEIAFTAKIARQGGRPRFPGAHAPRVLAVAPRHCRSLLSKDFFPFKPNSEEVVGKAAP